MRFMMMVIPKPMNRPRPMPFLGGFAQHWWLFRRLHGVQSDHEGMAVGGLTAVTDAKTHVQRNGPLGSGTSLTGRRRRRRVRRNRPAVTVSGRNGDA